MANEIKLTYREIEIEYSEYFNSWTCFLNKSNLKSDSLKEIKEKIDQFIKRENPFKRFDCLLISGKYSYGSKEELGAKITVTSIADDGECWTIKNGSRAKMNHKFLAVDNDDNRKLIACALDCMKKAKELEKKADEYTLALERLPDGKAVK